LLLCYGHSLALVPPDRGFFLNRSSAFTVPIGLQFLHSFARDRMGRELRKLTFL
jgi:hypothetical protein